MSKKSDDVPKVSVSNTKKELLEAYNRLVAMYEARAAEELRPEKAREDKRKAEVVKTADKLAGTGDLARHIESLKSEVGKELNGIQARIEEQVSAYVNIKEAVESREKELQELFEIERSAFSLAALLEAERRKKEEYEQQMSERRKELESEMEDTRQAWEKEKSEYEARLKEQRREDEKRKQRQEEEYNYNLQREHEQKKNELLDNIQRLEKELAGRQEEFDKKHAAREEALQQRETAVGEREKEMADLQARIEDFPRQMEDNIAAAVKQTSDRLQAETAKNEELLRKTHEGELNVLNTRIKSLEQTVSSQNKQISELTSQLEKAYGKVQDIAVQAVSSPSRSVLPESRGRYGAEEDTGQTARQR